MNKTLFKPQLAYNPGETLEELLEEVGMSQIELATRSGLSTKTINEIIKGKNPISHETAIKLERIFGVSASFWNNLQKIFDEHLARKKANSDLSTEVSYLEKYSCYAEMAAHGWVPKVRNKVDKINNLLNFFKVDSLSYVPAIHNVAFRKSNQNNLSQEALMAWLRQGEIEAEKITTKDFNAEKLKELIPFFRSLTKLNANDFSKKIVEECAKYGVAVVFLPALKNTYVNGATRWLTKDKALLQLSLRNKYADIFWFSFFHELGHILIHGKRDEFVDIGNNKSELQKEIEADSFAQESLLPAKDYLQFKENKISMQTVYDLSEKVGVSKGIIFGRLAHDGLVKWQEIAKHRMKLKFI